MIRDVTEEEKNTYFVMETDYNINMDAINVVVTVFCRVEYLM